ncbi:MAG: GTP-binding protein, partial [Candidatus Omnitrophica bacterium]|nr:GTP-binding protein [Candidatus Omnitrophota bacterium]
LRGDLSKTFASFKEETVEILSEIEACLNFPDDYPDPGTERFLQGMRSLLHSATRLKESAEKGRIFVEGVKAAIVGRTNVGKSSLLNALLRQERALVTEIPGTTRDALQETITLKGIPVTIIDTAGWRKARGRIERMGVAKAREWMDRAEVNLLILDASRPLTKSDWQLIDYIRGKRFLLVLNKCDLPVKINRERLSQAIKNELVCISAKTGLGLIELEERLYQLLLGCPASDSVYLNLREQLLLDEIIGETKQAISVLEKGESLEFVTDNLKSVIKALEGLSGETVADEVLNRIFSRFCIGK